MNAFLQLTSNNMNEQSASPLKPVTSALGQQPGRRSGEGLASVVAELQHRLRAEVPANLVYNSDCGKGSSS
jgi:hypothetical protein